MMGKRRSVDAMASRAATTSPVVSRMARHTDMLRPGRSWTVTSTWSSGAGTVQKVIHEGDRIGSSQNVPST